MGIGDIADNVVRAAENAQARVSEALFEPVVRLGVTGLSQAGKTVFITSLVANLTENGRMPQLRAKSDGRLLHALLRPQPDDTVPRFAYEEHLAALTGKPPVWPQSTRAVSELRLSFRVERKGLLGAVSGPGLVHIDIVDYPGEWLLDLGLLDQSFGDWSKGVLATMTARPGGEACLEQLGRNKGEDVFDEAAGAGMAAAYADYLKQIHEAGFSNCTPGRFLLPGDLAGSPVLTFAPLSADQKAGRGTLWHEFERRFEAYKREVVKPFFREHFSRIDRQVVLVDVLGAIHKGPQETQDMRESMAAILSAFTPGKISFLRQLIGQRGVAKILFAATKADHLHHGQHDKLSDIAAALLSEARTRADFAGAKTASMSVASVRSTVEEDRKHGKDVLACVRGTLLDGKQAAFYPGDLPDDPAEILSAAGDGAEKWLDGEYGMMNFQPSLSGRRSGEGLPHIRLDRAAEFLFGDVL